jgi:hypothetical protein
LQHNTEKNIVDSHADANADANADADADADTLSEDSLYFRIGENNVDELPFRSSGEKN